MKYTHLFFIFCIAFQNKLPLLGCTGIRLLAQDGTVIYARTLEWRQNLNPHAIIIPKNTSYIGTSIEYNSGLSWSSLYSCTGITIGDLPFFIDGINDKGLAAGLFSFRDDIEYHKPDNHNERDLAPWELITYLLGNCTTIDEVKNILTRIKIVPVYFDLVEEVPPLHYIVHDIHGNCIVLEHSNHEFKIYDNPLGVMTNSPNFDWHITHLNTYLRPSFENHKTFHTMNSHHNVSSFKVLHESYAAALPADFSSPSRFIRAAIYSLCSPTPKSGYEGILQAFHILNQFDIPKGAFRTIQEDYFTYTHWTSAINLQEKKYYFRTHENQRIRLIDLAKISNNLSEITWFSMNKPEDIEELT